ncbi:MAG: ABC transporter substrate-binding protein [Acidobacteriota bacterium]|nr:ABC transporter substrate-binding protein [Acidobacteriota bacterium]
MPKAALAALAAVAVAGCGEVKNTITPQAGSADTITVALPGQPNAFYVGLYEAQALGLFRQADLNVRVRVPAAGEDPVTMVHDNQVLAAISSEPNVLLHRNLDQPVVGVAAIVHAPLQTIAIRVPAAGPSGGAGVGTGRGTSTTTKTRTKATTTPTKTRTKATTPTKTRTRTKRTRRRRLPTHRTTRTTTTATSTSTSSPTSTTPTTTTVSEVDATTWPSTMQRLLSTPGHPTYNGLVVVVRKDTIVNDAQLVRRFVQALARGYRAARANPTQAITNLINAVPSLAAQRALESATLRAALPYFFPPGLKVWGFEKESEWNSFGSWLSRHQLLSNGNAITDASTNELLPGQGV